VLRHRLQAISLSDYEALAREASPAIAVARALPATRTGRDAAPGWVTVIVVPRSADARPQPTAELRRAVSEFLSARVPASAAAQIRVAGPQYLPVDAEAVVAARKREEAGRVHDNVAEALARFFHPLTGGPEGEGWPFGRDVYISDVARALEEVEGVDFVESLVLKLDGAPQGETVAVPSDCIVVAGKLQVRARGPEEWT
jgi:hypothetical protein